MQPIQCRWKQIVATIVALSLLPSTDMRGQSSGAEPLPAGDASDEERKSCDNREKLMPMDIDQLVNIDLAESAATIPTGTLGARRTDDVSSHTVTHITREQIEESGALTLAGTPDIFVPNLGVNRHHSYQGPLAFQ